MTSAGLAPTARPRLAVVGIHGHGTGHLARAQELDRRGLARLVAVADLRPAAAGVLDPRVREFPGLAELLAEVAVDVVVICTPIHTHFALTKLALEAGVDVLLEKPPVTSLAEFSALREVVRATGRQCQVGFQSLGSRGVARVRERVARGDIGTVTGVTATGCWVRTREYWTRSAWAGRRVLAGTAVVDGAVTNPFAHAVATALALVGATRASDLRSIALDLYRANAIDADDTSVVRLTTSEGLPLTLAFTLCATEPSEPSVTVHGTAGRIVFFYAIDVVQVFLAGRTEPVTTLVDRVDLLDDLLAARGASPSPLLVEFAETEAFTAVLDAVRRADDPRRVAPGAVDWVGDGAHAHAVLRDVEHWIERATCEHRTFAELGAPWTKGLPPT